MSLSSSSESWEWWWFFFFLCSLSSGSGELDRECLSLLLLWYLSLLSSSELDTECFPQLDFWCLCLLLRLWCPSESSEDLDCFRDFLCFFFFSDLPPSSSEDELKSLSSRKSALAGEDRFLFLLLLDFFFFFGLLDKLASKSGILSPVRNPPYSSNMSSATICWLGSSSSNPPRGGLIPGFCLSSVDYVPSDKPDEERNSNVAVSSGLSLIAYDFFTEYHCHPQEQSAHLNSIYWCYSTARRCHEF